MGQPSAHKAEKSERKASVRKSAIKPEIVKSVIKSTVKDEKSVTRADKSAAVQDEERRGRSERRSVTAKKPKVMTPERQSPVKSPQKASPTKVMQVDAAVANVKLSPAKPVSPEKVQEVKPVTKKPVTEKQPKLTAVPVFEPRQTRGAAGKSVSKTPEKV